MPGLRFIPLLICLWIAATGVVATGVAAAQPAGVEPGPSTALLPEAAGQLAPASRPTPAPGLGMVWLKPEDDIRAAADLRAMSDLGVRAIRTSVWEDRRLFDLADTLGILVFQELPITYPTARTLGDSLAYALRLVERVRAGGRVHALGLAYAPDTSDPSTCALLAEMTEAAGASLKTYVVSEFESADSCPGSVDLVLLRGERQTADPETHAGEMGVAVSSDQDLPEYEGAQQAEYFATHLPARLSGEAWTFVYRWADVPNPSAFAARPGAGLWGLHREDGSSRPAVGVVEGAVLRAQRAFPRPVPRPAETPTNGYVLAGWAMVLALLTVYASSPRVRSMAGRYFAAHGIYRTAVADDRDNMILSNVVVLLCMSLLFGMVAEQALRSYADHPAYAALWNWSGAEARGTLDLLTGSPVRLSLVIGFLALSGVLIWMVAWYLAAARSSGGTFNQVMTLSIWPRWPVLVTLPVVMLVAAGSWGDVAARYSVLWVLVTGAWSTIRTNVDAAYVLRMRPLALVLLWLFGPFVPILLAGLWLAVRHGDKLAYLQQLAR